MYQGGGRGPGSGQSERHWDTASGQAAAGPRAGESEDGHKLGSGMEF